MGAGISKIILVGLVVILEQLLITVLIIVVGTFSTFSNDKAVYTAGSYFILWFSLERGDVIFEVDPSLPAQQLIFSEPSLCVYLLRVRVPSCPQ